jgi:2',3'-cyclic-nucleotide 2'-phosphodiesterase (5'-nucleotidase family)
VVDYDGRLVAIPVKNLPPDPATKKLVDAWEGKVSDLVDIKIGFNPAPMNVPQVTAAMERAWRETYKTDFAFVENGSARDDLPAGDILIRHIYNIFPFNNTLVILDLDRTQICRILPKAEFKDDKLFYTLITNSYCGRELAGNLHLSRERIHPMKTTVREALIEYIREHGTLNLARKEDNIHPHVGTGHSTSNTQ